MPKRLSKGHVARKKKNVKSNNNDGRVVDKKSKAMLGTGFLNKITARKGYVFNSDYFQIDNGYATILTVFNKTGSDDNLSPMWGINLIPRNLGDGVTTRLLMQVNQAEQKWVDQKQSKADDVSSSETAEVARSNRTKDSILNNKKQKSLVQIAEDLAAGDSYLFVAFKVLIKAPSMSELDSAVDRLKRLYDTLFGAVYLTAFDGQQRTDVENLFKAGQDQLGKNYMFTSTEFAGVYNLVTHGIEDVGGEYVGQMREDVNNAAVLWDINNFDRHAIIATENRASTISYPDRYKWYRSSSLWGVKVSQAALVNNHRVVHFVLNGDRIGEIGVDLSDITSYVAMDKGDINPLELFGIDDDELTIFSTHVEKLVLMLKQLEPELDDIALNLFRSQVSKFYVKQKMWVTDAQHNRENIRIVGIPHEDVPLLQKMYMYFEVAYKAYINSNAVDPNISQALLRLRGLTKNMMEINGDLFNKPTSSHIDAASVSPRVIYDLSSLVQRGTGVAMAQFVNVLGFATTSLQDGDVILIHGADLIDVGVKSYLKQCIDTLYAKKVRAVFIYDSVEKMLANTDLNKLDSADWVLTGFMSKPEIATYQERLGVNIPMTLINAVTNKNHTQFYLRRGFDNIIFDNDLILD